MVCGYLESLGYPRIFDFDTSHGFDCISFFGLLSSLLIAASR
jgi:hypothetical protein